MNICNKKNALLALLMLGGLHGSYIQCGNAQKKQEKKLNTLLLTAVENNNKTEVVNLIGQGANVNMHNNNGESLFDIVMDNLPKHIDKKIAIEIAKILIQNNFNPNNKGKDRRPLERAFSYKNSELMKLLINKGADVTILQSKDRELLDVCIKENMTPAQYQICELLLHHKLVSSKECEKFLIIDIDMALRSKNENNINTVKLFLEHGTSINPQTVKYIVTLDKNNSNYKPIIDLIKNRHIIYIEHKYIQQKNTFHTLSDFYDCDLTYKSHFIDKSPDHLE